MTTKEYVQLACKALDDKKGIDIKVLDIREISSLGDYFVIASGHSNNQVQAMADEAEEKLRLSGAQCMDLEGRNGNTWILMDYGEFIIHIFKQEDRRFYDLERIWRDAIDVTEEILS